MRISRLITTNTKGMNLDQELSGRDIFIGPNGSGKSTRLESFLIGLLGYVPGKGKELSDTFKKCSGDELSVTLETDTDFKCTRTIKEKKTKHQSGDKSFSLSMSASVFPPRGERTDNERKSRIATELGDFSVMFDLNSLFALSDNERRKLIFSLTDPGEFGWTKERFLEEVSRTNEKFGKHTGKLSVIWRTDCSVQENVSNCLAWIKDQISIKKASLKKALAAKEQLLQQKREIGSDPGSAADLGAEYQKALQEQTSLAAQIAAVQEKLKTAKMLKVDIGWIKNKLDSAEIVPIPETQLISHKNTASVLTAELERLNEEIRQYREQIYILNGQLMQLAAPYEAAKAKLDEVTKIINNILRSKGICPLIGKKCKANLTEYVERLGAERDIAQNEMNSAGQKRNAVIAKIQDIEGRIKISERTKDDYMKTITQERDNIANIVKQNALATQDRENRKEMQENMDKKNKELSGLELVDINALEAARAGLTARIQQLERDIDKRKTIANLRQSFDRANIEATEIEEEVDILDDLAKFLGPVNLQGRILKDTMGPLIAKVNSLLEMTGRSYNLRPVMQDKNEKEIFDFAWQRDKQDVNFESLSGGERVVFGAALACALVLQKNPPLKALVIEAAEADPKNLEALMEAINKFGGDIGNVMIATHIDLQNSVPGWTTHKLG